MSQPLMEVRGLKKYFPIEGSPFGGAAGQVKAVDGVSFTVARGETLGLVGESGCGKSTVARTAIRLYEPTEGESHFDGMDVYRMSKGELRRLRRRMQIIFQDPYSSLDPRQNVENIVGEALIDHGLMNASQARGKTLETLELCGLGKHHMNRYPHEFSGGQRQRIGIARALALDPDFIVADEPVSALDVSIQSQILNLMADLQQRFGFSYLFISHDLSVVHHISDRIGVMYLGALVELTGKEELYKNPLHPYTQALLSAIPIADPSLRRTRISLTGDIPSPANPPSGCKFHTRCPHCTDACKERRPELREVAPGHFVACHIV